MIGHQSGVVTRRIGFELELHRRTARLTLEDVGAALGVPAVTISRWENGLCEPTGDEVASILTAIDAVRDERRLPAPSAPHRGYQDLERRATSVFTFELVLVPDLLQTADYARAAITTFHFHESDDEVDARVAQRLARQAILTRRQPPRLDFVLTEAALRLPMGGHRVMAAQVRHLIDVADRPGVTVRVIPAEVAAHPGLAGPVVLLGFADAPDVACLESRVSGALLDHAPGAHRVLADRLKELSLDEQGSVELMEGVERELRQG